MENNSNKNFIQNENLTEAENVYMFRKKQEKERLQKEISGVPYTTRLLFLCSALILGYFYQRYIVSFNSKGISTVIFWLGFLLASWAILKDKVNIKNFLSILGILTIISIGVHNFLYEENNLRLFNNLSVPFISVATLIYARMVKLNEDKEKNLDFSFFFNLLRSMTYAFFKNILTILPFTLAKNSIQFDNHKNIDRDKPNKRGILMGILISIPLVIVLIALLSLQDLNFKEALDSFKFINFDLRLDTLAATIFAALYFYAITIEHRIAKKEENKTINEHDSLVSSTVIVIVNIVFGIYTILQIKTLYLPARDALVMSQPVSSYAREGFFSLLLILTVNLLLIYFSKKYTENSKKLNVGLYILVAFTVNMIVSSIYRMSLYESIYGFTYKRLSVRALHVFFTTLIPLLIIYIRNKKFKLVNSSIAAFLIVLSLVQFFNIDAIIAKSSAKIYKERGKIDGAYIYRNLSIDAERTIDREFMKNENRELKLIGENYINYSKDSQKTLYSKDDFLNTTLSKYRFNKIYGEIK